MTDITPTWRAAAEVILMCLENGTDEGKRLARDEVRLMARLLDESNSRIKEARESVRHPEGKANFASAKGEEK